MRARLFAAVASAVAALAAVASCSADARTGPSAADLPVDRVADEVFQAGNVSLIEYAKNKLTADCMARNGFPQLAQAGVHQNPEPFSDMNVQPPLFAQRTAGQARLLGFGENEPGEAAHVLSSDPGFDRHLTGCFAEAGQTLGAELGEVQAQSYQLYNDIADERDKLLASPEETAKTDALLRPMLACVEGQGFHQVKPGPRTLDTFGIGYPSGTYQGAEPPAPSRRPGSVEIVAAKPERRYVPSAAEARLAVAATDCAQLTKFGAGVTDQRIRLLRQAMGEHDTQIAELRPKVEKVAKAAAQVVGR